MIAQTDRRPLKTRTRKWVPTLTRCLCRTGITPNQISVLSLVFAGSGALALLFSPGQALLLIPAAICIQLRLLANMMDGLVAVEGEKASYNGQLYNEVPDRIADVILLVSAGYATGEPYGVTLGWIAACGALLTASARLQGANLRKGTHDFCGPFAKPQRMFFLTAGALLSYFLGTPKIIFGTLALITFGTYYTYSKRLFRLSTALKEDSV